TDLWASAGMQKHSYPRFLGHLLLVLGVGGLTPVVFGTIGFVAERYRTAGPRDLVAACFYWALASVVGYPAVVDIMAGWTAVHVLVPLAVPAAVGLALVLRKGRAAIARDDGRTTAVVVVLSILALTATIGGAVAINFAYPAHPKNPVVQYAQPAGDMKPTLHEIERISAANEGVDVTFYGGDFYAPEDLSKDLTLSIEDGGYRGWFDRLPMAWYFELYGTNVSSTTDPTWIRTHRPPVVITLEETADDLEGDMEGYRRVTHQGYLHSRPLVFYLRRDAPRASR
ncbi:MAG: TIGR03663 family protein, partial [Halodesulfurarchaeum sp.]